MNINLLSNIAIKFDWLSIVIIVLVLIFVIKGLFDGLIKSILSIASGILVLVVSILVAKPLGNMLFNTGLGESLTNSLTSSLVSINEGAFNTPIPATNQEEAIAAVLTSLQVPGFLSGILSKLILSLITIEGEGTIGFLLGKALSQYIFYFLSGLVIFILLKVVFLIITIATKNFNKIPVVGPINRVLGAVLGLLYSFVIVSVVIYGVSLLMTISEVKEYFTALLHLNDPEVWSISKWFLNNNFIHKIIQMYL